MRLASKSILGLIFLPYNNIVMELGNDTVLSRDVEAVDFQAASTASASASNLQFKY